MHETSMNNFYLHSPFRNWPPLGKLVLSLALILATLFTSSPAVPLVVLAIGVILFSLSSRFYLPRIFLFAYIDTLLVILIGALIIAMLTPGSILLSIVLGPLTLTLTREGTNLGLLVFLRALADLSILLFFASSTSIPHFFTALRQVGFSASLSELAVLIYRYSFLLADQVELMITAAQCRLGFRGLRNSIRTVSIITARVFSRSMDLAERGQYALYCRNFQGSFPSFRQPPKLTAIWIVIPIAIFFMLYCLGYLTAGWLVV